MNKSQLLKSILKRGGEEKPSFGKDPNDPWSAKANITEDAFLNKYLKSRGINPEFATKDQKVAHSKTGEFQKWKRDHLNDVSVRTESYVDKRDTVTFDIPFLIRVLEYAREDAKTDMDLHKVVTKLIQIRNKGVLTMKDYTFVTRIKEHFEISDLITEQEVKNPVKKEWEKHAQNRSEIWRKKRLKIDEASYINGVKQDPESKVWKLTSLSHADAVAKHGKENVRHVDAVNRSGDKTGRKHVEVLSKLGEETEQLDELSVNKMLKYSDAAEKDRKKLNAKWDAGTASRKEQEKAIGREEGENRATNKIKKKTGKYPWQLNKEEVEQIDELTKGTLTSYATKARADAANLMKQGDAASKRSSSKSLQTARDKFRKATSRNLGAASAESKARIKEEKKMKGEDPCWKGYQMVGTKKKGSREVPNCVPEEVKSIQEDKYQDPMAATQTVGSEVDTDTAPKRKREMTKSARIIKAIYKKKRVKEELYDHEKENKGGKYGEKSDAALVMKGGKTMTGTSRDTIEVDPMMKPRPGKPDPSKR